MRSSTKEEVFGIEASGRTAQTVVHRRISPIRPLAGNADTAKVGLTNNQRVDARYTPLLEYFEAMPSKGVERMTYLRPSQRRTVVKCSLH